jgi:hypothetical protein
MHKCECCNKNLASDKNLERHYQTMTHKEAEMILPQLKPQEELITPPVNLVGLMEILNEDPTWGKKDQSEELKNETNVLQEDQEYKEFLNDYMKKEGGRRKSRSSLKKRKSKRSKKKRSSKKKHSSNRRH